MPLDPLQVVIGQAVSLGNIDSKTTVIKTGTLITTAVTVDQVILTYTVTAGKTLYLQYFNIHSHLTVLSATAVILGTGSVELPSGTKIHTETFVNPTTSAVQSSTVMFAEPIPIAGGTVIRCVCTPAVAVSRTWHANFGGYEK